LFAVGPTRTLVAMGANQTHSAAGPSSRSIEHSMNALRSIVRALRINTRAIELKMGISLAQLFVLQQLAERPAASLNELAERTATHQSSVSVVVRRLVERGYVLRTSSSSDKRRIEIDVTPIGRALLAGAPTTIQTQLMAALGRMSANEQTTLADLLDRWLREAKIDIAAPPMLGEDEAEVQSASV
jgi:DNA-binding MarR family transcriptional regulator